MGNQLRGAVECLGQAFGAATGKAWESDTEGFALAAGGENQTYPEVNQEVAANDEMERVKGFEPSTSTLARSRSSR